MSEFTLARPLLQATASGGLQKQPGQRPAHHSRYQSKHSRGTYSRITYSTSQRITVATPASYTIEVRVPDGRTYHLAATNDLDRLDLDAASSRTLHQLLKQGGKLRLAIRQHQQLPIEYRFTIYNADGYEAAYQNLMALPAPAQPD
jgi:hypothetical protein